MPAVGVLQIAGCDRLPCLPGYSCRYAEFSLACSACQRGLYSSDGINCNACTAGKGPNRNGTACIACPAGKYSDMGICVACEANTVPNILQTACMRCRTNQVPNTAGDACECKVSTYNTTQGYIFCWNNFPYTQRAYRLRRAALVKHSFGVQCLTCPSACVNCSKYRSPCCPT